MPRDRMTMGTIVRAGLRRSPWQTAAGLVASAVLSGALIAALTLMVGMDRLLGEGLSRLGADIIIAPRSQGPVVEQLLRTGATARLGASISVEGWMHRLKAGRVVGIKSVQGWNLASGGAGKPAAVTASVLLIHLERWAPPMVAREEITAAIPEADVVVAEQVTRSVARNLQPLVRYLSVAAGVALLAGLLMTGLLTAIRVTERRAELGMLRAMGAARLWLVGATLVETGAMAFGGALLGLGAVGAALGLMEQPRSLLARLTGLELGLFASGTVAATVCVTLIAALGSALRAATMDPLEAARQGR